MPVRTILVILDPGSDIETVLDGALHVARRMEGHLKVLLLQPDPDELTTPYAAVLGEESVDAIHAHRTRTTESAKARFETWRRGHALPAAMVDRMLHSTFAEWHEWNSTPSVGLVRYGRLADLIVLAAPRDRAGLPGTLIDAALFDTGRPVLLLPGPVVVPLLERVAIAWNSSLQAVRCLALAAPLLHEATHADVFAVHRPERTTRADPAFIPSSEVVEALSWHGVQATAVTLHPEGDEPVGTTLLRAATQGEVGLLVMGAFTKSRIQESLLGDVTRAMLDNSTIPLLMVH